MQRPGSGRGLPRLTIGSHREDWNGTRRVPERHRYEAPGPPPPTPGAAEALELGSPLRDPLLVSDRLPRLTAGD